MLSLSVPNALLFLQPLIAIITISPVNVCAILRDFLVVTNRVSLEEVFFLGKPAMRTLLNG